MLLEPDPATGQAVPTLSSSDVFLVMNGGKEGNQTEFMKPFVGAKKYVKNIMLCREEVSAMNRLGKVQGYAMLSCLENLLVVQAEKSKVKKATYEHCPTCSTLANMVGARSSCRLSTRYGVGHGKSRRSSAAKPSFW